MMLLKTTPPPPAAPVHAGGGVRATQQQQQQQGDIDDEERTECIRVIARIRPLPPMAAVTPSASPLTVLPDGKTLQVVGQIGSSTSTATGGGGGRQISSSFSFHACVPPQCNQAESFERSGVKALIEAAVGGYAATCFAYGQTAAGKTHTLVGADSVFETLDERSSEGDGIISRSMKHMFSLLERKRKKLGVEYSVKASFLEIYNEQVHDMLQNGPPLHVKWNTTNGFFVQGLNEIDCASKKDVMKVFCRGFRGTRIGSHDLNARSNRSHCMFTVSMTTSIPKPQGSEDNEPTILHGKLTFVDLAGSERQKLTGSSAVMLRESGQINKSLFNLGKVISILSEGKEGAFVPFRDSKLTRLLKDSIGGTAKTLMITCCSSSPLHLFETMRSLEFAQRAMHIRNKPVVILDEKEALIRELRKEIRRLKVQNQQLQEAAHRGPAAPPPFPFHSMASTSFALVPPSRRSNEGDNDDDYLASTAPTLRGGGIVALGSGKSRSRILPGGGTIPIRSQKKPVPIDQEEDEFEEKALAAAAGLEGEEDDDDYDEDLQKDILSRSRLLLAKQPRSAPSSLIQELSYLVDEYASVVPASSKAETKRKPQPKISQKAPTPTFQNPERPRAVPPTHNRFSNGHEVEEEDDDDDDDSDLEGAGVWAEDEEDARQEMAELEAELAREIAGYIPYSQRQEGARPFSQGGMRAPPPMQVVSADGERKKKGSRREEKGPASIIGSSTSLDFWRTEELSSAAAALVAKSKEKDRGERKVSTKPAAAAGSKHGVDLAPRPREEGGNLAKFSSSSNSNENTGNDNRVEYPGKAVKKEKGRERSKNSSSATTELEEMMIPPKQSSRANSREGNSNREMRTLSREGGGGGGTTAGAVAAPSVLSLPKLDDINGLASRGGGSRNSDRERDGGGSGGRSSSQRSSTTTTPIPGLARQASKEEIRAALPVPAAIVNELDTLKQRVDRAEAAIRMHMDVMSSWSG